MMMIINPPPNPPPLRIREWVKFIVYEEIRPFPYCLREGVGDGLRKYDKLK
jgi:hypothetical protein